MSVGMAEVVVVMDTVECGCKSHVAGCGCGHGRMWLYWLWRDVVGMVYVIVGVMWLVVDVAMVGRGYGCGWIWL